MAKTLNEHKRSLAFESNEVFEAVIAYLDANIEGEVDRAISYNIEGEKRIHGCGRAESLRDFKDLLLSENQDAKAGKYGS
jgi:hypothetical protein